MTGLEPVASWSRTKHATKLRYTPKSILNIIAYFEKEVKRLNKKIL